MAIVAMVDAVLSKPRQTKKPRMSTPVLHFSSCAWLSCKTMRTAVVVTVSTTRKTNSSNNMNALNHTKRNDVPHINFRFSSTSFGLPLLTVIDVVVRSYCSLLNTA
uniref:Serine carboxypeptidase-like 17 n=1 Tax=Lygus hesperus TaxID=30085 RepID=A0A0A9YFH9_LYGHE